MGDRAVRIIVLMFLTFVLGTSEFMVMGILPDIAVGIGVQYTMVGSMVTVFALSYAVSTPILSMMFARYNRFKATVLFFVVFMVSDVWTMLSDDYWSMVLSRIVTAAVSGVLFSLVLNITVDISESRSRDMAWMYAAFNISFIIGIPLGTVISNIFGWRSVFLFILILSLVSLLMFFMAIPRDAGEVTADTGRASLTMMRDPRTILGILITVFAFAGSYTVYTYLTPLLEDVVGFPDEYVGIGLMLFGTMCMVSNLLAARLAERGGLRLGRITFLIQAIVLAVLPTALASPVIGFLFLMIVGFMMYLMNSSAQTLLMDVAIRDYPDSIPMASALNPSAFNIGIVFGSMLAGVIYDCQGAEFLGYGGAVFILSAMVCSILVCRISDRRVHSDA
ncbi:MAG: MFS transporter [Candidatus Methanomethylophilaceae archaeon]|nr:MFS transporter [Candidatus Methanomethylophilaceae archaeon]